MTDDELLAKIRADPYDDQRRLVYADALLARGDVRGEYIRLAIASARGAATREQSERLRYLAQREREWAAELGCALQTSWGRGLPCSIWGTAQAIVAQRDTLRTLPFVAITLSSDSRDLAAFAALPELASIEELTISRSLPRDELAALCASPNLTALRQISFGEMSDDTAELVSTARWLAQLEVLPVHGLSGRGFARVLAEPLFRLKELTVYSCELGEEGGRAFAKCKLPRLEQVRFERTRLQGGARDVLGSANLAAVHTLRITHEYLADHGADALGQSPYPRALRTLSFENAGIGSQGVIALARGNGAPFPELTTLDLQHCLIENDGAVALASSSRFPSLAKLDLSDNQLSRDGALAFASPTAIPTLTELRISRNSFPTGAYEAVTIYDQGYEVGGAALPVQVDIDVIRSWFANRPTLRVL